MSSSYRSTNERVGAVVLFPLKAAVAVLAVALVVLAYLPVALVHFVTNEGRVSERAKSAAVWPLGILAMNDFMSLGGMDNPTLSRISSAINKGYHKIKRTPPRS